MAAGQYIDVPSIAQTVLIGVVAHFNAAGVELPDRQLIPPGEPRSIAWDCDAVLVTLAGIGVGQAPGQGGGARQTGNPTSVGARHAVIVVQIVRCVPEPVGDELTDAEKTTEAGLALIKDAALLSQALAELCGQSGALRRAGSAIAGAVEPIGPSGGYAAVEGNVTVTAKDLA